MIRVGRGTGMGLLWIRWRVHVVGYIMNWSDLLKWLVMLKLQDGTSVLGRQSIDRWLIEVGQAATHTDLVIDSGKGAGKYI